MFYCKKQSIFIVFSILLILFFHAQSHACDPKNQSHISTYQWENYLQLRQKAEHQIWAKFLPQITAKTPNKIFDWPMAYLGGQWLFYHLFGTCGDLRTQKNQIIYTADDIEISPWMPNKFQLEHQSFKWDYQWFARGRIGEKFQLIALTFDPNQNNIHLKTSAFYDEMTEVNGHFAIIHNTKNHYTYSGILAWQNNQFIEILPLNFHFNF